MRPLLPRPGCRHGLHEGPGGELGGPGELISAAARQALCDGCGLWLGHGLLPVQRGGEVVGDLGLSAGIDFHSTEGKPGQGL